MALRPRCFMILRTSSFGSWSFATDLRALRVLLPFVEQVTADAQFLGNLGDRLAGADQLNRLGFEFRGVALSGFVLIWTDCRSGRFKNLATSVVVT